VTLYQCFPRQAVSWLYFFSRYISLIQSIIEYAGSLPKASIFTCDLEYFQGLVDQVPVISVDYILLLRVLAFYSWQRRLVLVLRMAFVAEVIGMIGFAVGGDILAHFRPETAGTGTLPFCLDSDPRGPEGSIAWSIPLLYEAILMVLVIYKAVILSREAGGLNGSILVRILIRDQAIYFVAVLVITTSKILEFNLGYVPSNIFTVLGYTDLLSVLGARLLLNMKEAGEREANADFSLEMGMSTSLNFANVPSQGTVGSALGFHE